MRNRLTSHIISYERLFQSSVLVSEFPFYCFSSGSLLFYYFFYRRHNELISKFNVGLKSLLLQGLSEPEFYDDLVYTFRNIRGMTDFPDQFRKL